MATNTTLKKIAEHLNISISTVSRALKDHPDVAKETIRRVKELAEMMDYEPNAFAVGLRKQKSNLFAVMVPEVGNYFYHGFIQAVEEDARRIGHSVLILQSMDDSAIEAQNLKICRHNNVAGVFVALSTQTENYEPFLRMAQHDIPLLFFDKVPDGAEHHKVVLADAEAGELAAEKVAESGATNILAIFGHQKLSLTKRRSNAFSQKMNAYSGLNISYSNADSIKSAQAEATSFLEKKPANALIFCMSDEILCGVMRSIQVLGLRVPVDCKVLALSAGFFPNLFSPVIDYIETSGYKLGKACFSRMIQIAAEKPPPAESHIACTYIAGQSL